MPRRALHAVTGDPLTPTIALRSLFVCLSVLSIIPSCAIAKNPHHNHLHHAISSGDAEPTIMAIDEDVLLETLQEHFRDRARNSVLKPKPLIGVTVWQLYNHCSNGFLQAFFKNVNARGDLTKNNCLLDFIVQTDSYGAILLQHVLSQKYVCFNRRKRITVKDDPHDHKCRFYEHVTKDGYTQLESAWFPETFLGFNRRGRFQDPSRYPEKRRCFLYTKMEKFVTHSEFQRCLASESESRDSQDDTPISPLPRSTEIARVPHSESQRMLYELARDSLLQRIQA